MKIGILQAGRSPDESREEFGDYDQFFVRYLDGRGFTFDTYPVLDGVLPDGPDAADGWLITGSKFGAYEGPYLDRYNQPGSERAVKRFQTYFDSPTNNSSNVS